MIVPVHYRLHYGCFFDVDQYDDISFIFLFFSFFFSFMDTSKIFWFDGGEVQMLLQIIYW